MIEVNKVSKFFGNTQVLFDISLSLQEGEIYGLLGPNGAGKSTLMNCIMGLDKINQGCITIDKEIFKGQNKLKSKIGFVPQELALLENLTVLENLNIFGGLYQIDKSILQKSKDNLIEKLGLTGKLNSKVDALSGGLKRRVNMACSLLHNPENILLDEPTVGVDPQSRKLILEYILDLKKQGKTILYTSHYMDEVNKVCDHIYLLDHGKLIIDQAKDQLEDSSTIGLESFFFQLTGNSLRD